MTILIIDDEPKARKLLEVLLEENCPQVTKIFVADGLLQGIKLIKKEKPQLVFLDVEMPEYSGLEILDFIPIKQRDFEIIFTTAYSQYALQAFELSAIDYLLKPLRPDKLIVAVERAMIYINKRTIVERLTDLKNNLESAHKKIGLPYSDGIKFIEIQSIIMFEADGMYTKVSTIENEMILVSKPLKYFVELLQKVSFFYRPHRSYLINLSYLKEYIKRDGGYILMENNKAVSISKDRREEFLGIIQNI